MMILLAAILGIWCFLLILSNERSEAQRAKQEAEILAVVSASAH